MNVKYINLISITAVFVLLIVQIYIVISIWSSHDKNIKLQYHTLATEALNEWRYSNGVDVLDTTFAVINHYSLETVVNLSRAEDSADSIEMTELFRDNTSRIISMTEHMSTAIETYFDSRDLLSAVLDSTEVYQLSLIGTNGKELSLIDRAPERSDYLISISTFINETDYYKISLNYYMNIKDKRSMIMKRSWFIIILTFISFVVVCYLFLLTYRNLIKEKRLSDMKTDFINNMTHELKTPLSTIAVATRALELEPIRKDESRVLDKARLIGRQNDHLNRLINKLLDINMWERENFTLDQECVFINSLLDDTILGFKSGVEQQITINSSYKSSPDCQVLLDKLHFTILINNLLTNAIKYCDKKPVIEILTESSDKVVTISIVDNGIGIRGVDIKSVFDKFYRVKQGDIHTVKGLGLGLFYAKRIVEAHGGEITVKSRVGEGTEFKISFNIEKIDI